MFYYLSIIFYFIIEIYKFSHILLIHYIFHEEITG